MSTLAPITRPIALQLSELFRRIDTSRIDETVRQDLIQFVDSTFDHGRITPVNLQQCDESLRNILETSYRMICGRIQSYHQDYLHLIPPESPEQKSYR
jgi:hypothetical protein